MLVSLRPLPLSPLLCLVQSCFGCGFVVARCVRACAPRSARCFPPSRRCLCHLPPCVARVLLSLLPFGDDAMNDSSTMVERGAASEDWTQAMHSRAQQRATVSTQRVSREQQVSSHALRRCKRAACVVHRPIDEWMSRLRRRAKSMHLGAATAPHHNDRTDAVQPLTRRPLYALCIHRACASDERAHPACCSRGWESS